MPSNKRLHAVADPARCHHVYATSGFDGRYETCQLCGSQRVRTKAERVASQKAVIPVTPLVIPEKLPDIHVADLLPDVITYCASCAQWRWARTPLHPGYILCAFCHPPQEWEIMVLDVLPFTPPLPIKQGLGLTFHRTNQQPKEPCANGHMHWVRRLPAFPQSWICATCHPGRGKDHDEYHVKDGRAFMKTMEEAA